MTFRDMLHLKSCQIKTYKLLCLKFLPLSETSVKKCGIMYICQVLSLLYCRITNHRTRTG